MNILITGGAGFIPSSLADRLLLEKDTKVVLVDNFLTGKQSNIPQHPNCKFVHCDVNKYDEIAPISARTSSITCSIMPLLSA
jgi:UDP-glucose 4-epimerase